MLTRLIALIGLAAGSTLATELKTDVVVVGATPGGVAAAVAAARSGAAVILVEETAHVGGIIAGGLTNNDLGQEGAVGGFFAEWRRRIRAYYTGRYGATSQQVKDSSNGNHYEAHVAESIFRQMLEGEPRVRVLTRHRLIRATRAGDRLTTVVLADLADSGRLLTIAAKVFVDATYEGDLAALAGVEYRVGRESRGTYGEPLAGRIYLKFGTNLPLADSTGEGDNGIQAFCFRIHVTKRPDNRVPFEQPPAYNRDDYRYLLADIQAGAVTMLRGAVQLYVMPNDKFEMNSDHPHPVPSESFDLAEECWRWPEADWQERQRIFDRYWNYHEGLLWFLQTDPAVPAKLRQETAQYGFCKDEFTDHRNRPHHLYVRQGRRIVGDYNFTQRDADPDPSTGLPPRPPDTIAAAVFAWDSHAVHKFDPAHPGVREGYFYVNHPPLPLPYRIIVPKKIDGLLVPVACSASHVGYQAIRVEPTFMALGDAAGIAAALAIRRQITVRRVPIPELQQEILRRGGILVFPPATAPP